MKHTARVFIHGWAQDASCWRGIARQHDLCLSLPGHGSQQDLPAEAWTGYCYQQLPKEPALLIGWSLGAMMALRLAARHPDRVRALLLLAATPKFVRAKRWLHGTSQKAFRAFEQGVSEQPATTLRRFTAMMQHGEKTALLRQSDYAPQAATQHALRAGLSLLREWDLRDEAELVECPVLLVHGRHDAVVPVAAAEALAKRLKNARLHVIDGGHALPVFHSDNIVSWADEMNKIAE